MKCAILRATCPDTLRGLYVARVAHDGDFTLTRDRSKARTFAPETAVAVRARLARTALGFHICPAPNVGPVSFPYVQKYIDKAEASA